MVQYKQKCARCKVNYVTVSSRSSFGATCFECAKKDMQGEITDPELKKLLDIPEEYFVKNSFLRNIKINALKYGKLSEKQIEVFKKVLEDVKSKIDKNPPQN